MELTQQIQWANDYFLNSSKKIEHPYDYTLAVADTLEKLSCYPLLDFSFLPKKYRQYMDQAVKIGNFDYHKSIPLNFNINEYMNKFFIRIYEYFGFNIEICEFVIINFQNIVKYGWDRWVNIMFRIVNYSFKN